MSRSSFPRNISGNQQVEITNFHTAPTIIKGQTDITNPSSQVPLKCSSDGKLEVSTNLTSGLRTFTSGTDPSESVASSIDKNQVVIAGCDNVNTSFSQINPMRIDHNGKLFVHNNDLTGRTAISDDGTSTNLKCLAGGELSIFQTGWTNPNNPATYTNSRLGTILTAQTDGTQKTQLVNKQDILSFTSPTWASGTYTDIFNCASASKIRIYGSVATTDTLQIQYASSVDGVGVYDWINATDTLPITTIDGSICIDMVIDCPPPFIRIKNNSVSSQSVSLRVVKH
tara:strand:- start:474 stop:1325 length:852 start_codon:yes stop_codon:yes gene_type:complete